MLNISRRKIQIVLGLLWVLDGLLQFQPKMFTSTFMKQVIETAQAGQPFYVFNPIHLGIKIFLLHPAIFNSLIILTQVGIGLLILFRQTTKYGLWLSVIWGLFVWYIGEAAAGIFSGHASLLMGLPGAVILYSIIALAVLPKKDDKHKPADYWLVFVWSGIWLLGTIYQLLPGQNSINSLQSMISTNAMGAPGWLSHLDTHLANSLNHLGVNSSMSGSMMMAGASGYLFIALIAAVQLFIAFGVLLNKKLRILAISLGLILTLIYWVIGQSLGGYFTGVMTDVQTGPLIVLLGLAIIGQPEMSSKLKVFYLKLEKILV